MNLESRDYRRPCGVARIRWQAAARYKGRCRLRQGLARRKAEAGNKLLKGQQISWYINEYFRINADQGAVLVFSGLISVVLQNHDVKKFLYDWESVLLIIDTIPSKIILESLFVRQLEKADGLRNLLELYRQDVTQRGLPKDYDRPLHMVKRHLEERRRKKTGVITAKTVGR